MTIKKKPILYDIANMAFVIADNGSPLDHRLHRVRDICEDGNIHRVARVLGLAYSQLLEWLSPLIVSPDLNLQYDNSKNPHDFVILFKETEDLKYSLTMEKKLKIKESCHEYMVCRVLHDWLSITFPEAADPWKFKLETAAADLKEIVSSVLSSSSHTFRRKLSPF